MDGEALTQIWMRGRPNLAAVLSYLMSAAGGSLGAAAGTEVILSGGSAGGTSAFLALDWVASFLPSTVKLVGAPDAGYFIDAPIWDQPSNYNFRREFQSGDAIWNSVGAGSLNHACLAAYPSEGWRCFFPEIHTPYLKTPWHAMMAAYDVASTSMIIDLCSPPSPCSAAELEALQLWRFTFIGQLAYGLDSYPGNGAYIDSCIVHEQNVDYCASQGQQNCHGWLTYNVTVAGYAPQLTPQTGFSVWASAQTRRRASALRRARAHRARSPPSHPLSLPPSQVDSIFTDYEGTMAAREAWHARVLASLPGGPAAYPKRSPAELAAFKAQQQAAQVAIIDPLAWPANPSCPYGTH